MDISASQGLDVQCDIQEDVHALLNAHVSHVTDEVRFAVFKSRIRTDRFESFQIRAVADNEYILRV